MAKYRKTSRDKILERANARKNQGNGGRCLTFKNLPQGTKVEFFKPTKAVHNLDIIGYVITDAKNPECDDTLQPGYLWYGRNYWVHRGVGADDDSVICNAKTFEGERCPICEYAKQRRASGEASKEELDALKPKQRQLFCVIDLDAGDGVVKLFDCSYHLFGKQLDKEILDSDDDAVSSFFEPTEGFTLRARFEKKSFNGREFFTCDRIDFKDRRKQYKEDIIDETFPLDDMLNKMSYEKVNELFVMGADVSAEEDEEQPAKPRRQRHEEDEEEERPARGRKRPVVEEEEEDEPVRGSEDDIDDTPPPRSRRKRPVSEDDAEIDETPAPKPKRGRQADRAEETEEEDDTPPPPRHSRGRKPDPEPEEEEEAPAKPSDKAAGGECPKGFKWGIDCDSDDACDDCKLWAGCNAAKRKAR